MGMIFWFAGGIALGSYLQSRHNEKKEWMAKNGFEHRGFVCDRWERRREAPQAIQVPVGVNNNEKDNLNMDPISQQTQPQPTNGASGSWSWPNSRNNNNEINRSEPASPTLQSMPSSPAPMDTVPLPPHRDTLQRWSKDGKEMASIPFKAVPSAVDYAEKTLDSVLSQVEGLKQRIAEMKEQQQQQQQRQNLPSQPGRIQEMIENDNKRWV